MLERYRQKDPRRLIGLMSGTSIDGVDAALVEIAGFGDDVRIRVAEAVTLPYSDGLRDEIFDAANGFSKTEELCRLNAALAERFADAARAVAEAANFPLSDVDAIGSHGQTVWHAPEATKFGGVPVRGTLQLGSGPVLAVKTGCLVVSDFRAADVALGGQGAPLAPLVDWLLLRHPTKSRAAQNLGGIANVTYLPAGGNTEQIIAFDTGPGCMLMDGLIRGYSQGAPLRYDVDGKWAANAPISERFVEFLLEHPYFSQPPPKSTGRELFNNDYLNFLFQMKSTFGLKGKGMVATATAFTAESIARAYRDFLPPVDEVILSGGGARNPTLVRMIGERLAPIPVLLADDLGIDSDSKEAMAFAVLADRTLQGLPGNVPQATGASRAAVLGSISLP